MDFKVSNTTYFLVCNGEKSYEKFDNKINFTATLIAYTSDPSWIPKKIKDMKATLESDKTPEYNENCESCIYLASEKSIDNIGK
jgi:hypothetical protein